MKIPPPAGMVLLTLLFILLSLTSHAQEPSLTDANRVLDYAEQAYPAAFPVPASDSGETVEAGFRWYYRYYASTDSFAAVNRDDGFLWVLGASFGADATQLMSVTQVLALVNAGEPTLQQANQIFDFAESSFPDLFPAPASSSGVDTAAGYRWYFRYYESTDTFAAVNRDDGHVWVWSEAFGPEPVQLMPVAEAMALLPSTPPPQPPPGGGGGTGGITSPGNGNCVAVVFPQDGTRTVHREEITGGGVSEHRYEWLTTTPSIISLKFENHVGGQLLSRFSHSEYLVISNGLIYATGIDAEGEQFGAGAGTYSNQSTYHPHQLRGPVDEYCEGQEWFSPAVTMTTVSQSSFTGNTTFDTPIGSYTSRVEAIDEVVDVPAGSFTTVKITTDLGSGTRSENWFEASTGTQVLTRTYNGNTLLSNRVLLEVTYGHL